MSIAVVGIGLGGAADLSIDAQARVDRATLLVGGARHLSYFLQHPAPKLALGNLDAAITQIQQHLADDAGQVVILASGDPLFFGLGRLLLTAFAAEQLTFYPHLSAVQMAFSRIKVPWQDATVVSLHGRSPDKLIQALKKGDEKIAVLTDSVYTPSALATLFLDLDLPLAYQFWVCEDLGGAGERVQTFDPHQLQGETFAALNIVILMRCDPVPIVDDWPSLGIPDHYFFSFPDRPSLMTKREVRVLAIAELDLRPQQVIWDIGAGTGSVTVEMARLCPSSTIYAVEKTAMGQRLIEKNCQRFQVDTVRVVPAEAPEELSSLPAPHRIFIGGSGGHLAKILDCCLACCDRDVILVLTVATLEHLEIARQWFHKHHWSTQLLQIQISRSVAISALTRWNPLNPVTLIKASPATLDESEKR